MPPHAARECTQQEFSQAGEAEARALLVDELVRIGDQGFEAIDERRYGAAKIVILRGKP